MLCNIAIDSSTKQLGGREENISRDFKIMKNLVCKGETPSLMPIRIAPLSYEE